MDIQGRPGGGRSKGWEWRELKKCRLATFAMITWEGPVFSELFPSCGIDVIRKASAGGEGDIRALKGDRCGTFLKANQTLSEKQRREGAEVKW